MQYWLLKTEPETFSFEMLLSRKSETWDGVRNYQARNNMKAMQDGDLCLIYHSGKEKGVAGIAQVVRTAYPDTTTDDDRWVCVDIAAVRAVPFFSLEEMKQTDALASLPLFKQSRLSVMPVEKIHFDILSRDSE